VSILASDLSQARSVRAIARAAGLGALCNVALLWVVVFIVPQAFTSLSSGAGLVAATLMQLLYGFVLLYSSIGLATRDFAEVRLTVVLGGAYGLVYGALMLSEYLVPVTTGYSELTGTIAVGILVVVCLVAGIATAGRTGSVWQASLAAMRAAMIGTLIWLLAYLVITYAFWGTGTQQAVLQAEGTFEDFAAHGGGDFAVFLIGDMQGAAFFHPLLSALIGLALGLAGGGIGRLAARRRGHGQ
jgi:hypothetical protein